MNWLAIYLRGVLMGAADIVPGVSGGTIAFITGIYDRLLGAIRAFDLALVELLLKGQIKAAWRHVDGGFVLALVAGIATSILSLARLIAWLLVTHPVPLWAFFFGLILASALVLLRQVGVWNPARLACLLVGIAFALAVALSPVLGLESAGLPAVFGAGFIAICAMILPGISGSFILVLLGMYAVVLNALKAFDLLFIAVFGAGAACGLLCFSRLLHWLLSHRRPGTLALLTGFLFGSLAVVWPWKEALDWAPGSHGELRPVQQVPVLPGRYLQLTGDDPQLWLCLALALAGGLAVWLIDTRWNRA
ncbi:DUF368 domain-containing protein [Parahaliea mediterranea]|uniref:DUF368 domain-containing protein n=1 Tax=Parahaliea mediterranea TaxID=651086 RepID=UPI0019D4C932|nr:DUF368 domain-containing protein [Parahaliea mediterranea]